MSTQRFPSKIEPNFDGGLLDASKLQGGVRIVKSKTARNQIPYLYRTLTATETTLCFVENDLIIYKLVNNPNTATTADADWEQVILMGVSTFSPVGTWDPANVDPELLDANAVDRNGEFYFVINTATPTEYTIPGLFNGDGTTVVDGNLVISVGTQWVVVANASTWDAMAKPPVIDAYVAGEVIAHTHLASEITDLAALLDEKYDVEDTADHTIAFGSVPDTAIIELEFLKAWYLTAVQIAAIVEAISAEGGAGATLADVDTSDPGAIILDMLTLRDVIFSATDDIGAVGTWTISNDANGQTAKFLLTLTDSYAQTFPSNFKMQTIVGDWDPVGKIWTPSLGAGEYEVDLTKKGANWLVKIYGPF